MWAAISFRKFGKFGLRGVEKLSGGRAVIDCLDLSTEREGTVALFLFCSTVPYKHIKSYFGRDFGIIPSLQRKLE